MTAHTVPDMIDAQVRLRIYLQGIFPQLATNSAIKKALTQGLITVNENVASSGYFVKPGDVLRYVEPEVQPVSLPDMHIPVIYEDDYMAVVCKPAGLLTSGNRKTTLANYLPKIVSTSTATDALAMPLLCHRLDKATSGLLLVAKTAMVRKQLGALLADHQVQKSYVALVQGRFPEDISIINEPIDSQLAKTEVVHAEHLSTQDAASFLRLKLHTGRTHQIRKHLLFVGHPIVGDPVYNPSGLTFKRGLMLSAVAVGLDHPITGERLEVEVPVPAKFSKYISKQSL